MTKNGLFLPGRSAMIHASLVAIPESGASLIGAFELLSSVGTAWRQVVEGSPGLQSNHVDDQQIAFVVAD